MLIPVRDVKSRIISLKIRKDDASKGGKFVWLTSGKCRGGKVCGVSPGAPVHVPMHDRGRESIRVTEGPLTPDGSTTVQKSGRTTAQARVSDVTKILTKKRLTRRDLYNTLAGKRPKRKSLRERIAERKAERAVRKGRKNKSVDQEIDR